MNRNAVGIDVSNGHSTVMVLKVVAKPFEIRHTVHGFMDLTKRLAQIDGDIRIVMEHTGQYYELVANVLHENGYFVSAVNPLLLRGKTSCRNLVHDKARHGKLSVGKLIESLFIGARACHGPCLAHPLRIGYL